MRIISGQARGRKLFTPDSSAGIRPTSDRAREALFSIIGSKILGSRVLDLYSGTGALGLEALSRGAEEVIFVDFHQKSIALTKRNCEICLQNISLSEGRNLRVIKHDLRRGVSFTPKIEEEQKISFDLIFLDPPYGKGLAEKTLQDIDSSLLLTDNSLIIAEESSGIQLPESFQNNLELSDQRKYGDTRFWFYNVRHDKE